MTLARQQQIDLETTPYYHCMGRCVRRAFLCGFDRLTRRNYDYRKQWLTERMATLAELFAINVCAYAIMSTHYHVVLHVDPDRSLAWSDDEVIKRWYRLYRRKAVQNNQVPEASRLDPDQIAQWRERLTSISWFMKALNEPIARRANKEDNCKGHFWQGRFRCRALVDDVGLLTCMAYVDLNAIHARCATTPETSDYTSVQDRIKRHYKINLMPFEDERRASAAESTIPFVLSDYLTLVDWSGRVLRRDKQGRIPGHLPPILERVHLPPDQWLQAVYRYDTAFGYFVGRASPLKAICKRLGRRWIKGLGVARRVYA
jgi:REP element-mobilizing transposase RayT